MATLTAANSVYLLGILSLYPIAQQLQGYDVDDAFSTDAVTSVETKMGVDAFMSAGWVPAEKKQTIMLQADSPSCEIFDNWHNSMEAAREAYVAFATISIPGLNKSYACVQGYLTSYIPISSVKRLTQPRAFGITWRSILPSPL